MRLVNNGVEAEERGGDAGLGEIKLADLGGDGFSEERSGLDGGEHEIGVGSDDGEDVGGFLEGEELLVEVEALGEEGVEVIVERALVGDALVEEASHGPDVGEGSDLTEGFRGTEFDGELASGGGGRWDSGGRLVCVGGSVGRRH